MQGDSNSNPCPNYIKHLVLDGIGGLAYTQVHKVRLLGGVLISNLKENNIMSRSYKKHPWVTDDSTPRTKNEKRIANKRVRHKEDTLNGGSYKHAYESRAIKDSKYMWTWEEAEEEWENGNNTHLKRRYPTLKAYYRYWLKCTKGK